VDGWEDWGVLEGDVKCISKGMEGYRGDYRSSLFL
jgi:hypothetical protein